MAKPFISYAHHRQSLMEWLRDLLIELGFEPPIVVSGGDPRAPLERVREELKRADCFFALISPERRADGTIAHPERMAPWVHDELAAAVTLRLPVGAICEQGVSVAGMLPSSFTWQEVDLDDPRAILAATAKIASMALRIKTFVDQPPEYSNYPFTYEKVRFIDRISSNEWRHYRTMHVAARQEVRGTEHAIGTMNHAPGVGLALVDPSRDLKVTSRQRPNLRFEITQNTSEIVAYRVVFDPPLMPGETIQYRHESRHPNVFPLTREAVRVRAAQQGSPPFMRAGLIGDSFAIKRPTAELIMEVNAPLELGLSAPEVRVYAADTTEEIEAESRRIGNPKSAPMFWQLDENEAIGEWTCRVTIPRPGMGYEYCLLVRPTL